MSYTLDRAKPNLTAKTMFGNIYLWIEPPGKRPTVRVTVSKSRSRKPKKLADALAEGLSGGAAGTSMSYDEFFNLVYYILKNEDIRADDPRIVFLETLKKARIVPGWNVGFGKKGSRRIQIPGFESHGEE